jgi:hypothetical protein
VTNENEPQLKTWNASHIHTEVKVISHVGTPAPSSNPFAHGNSRRVWFADGTYADTWIGAEVVNQLADRSLVGVPLEIIFSGTAIIDVKRVDEPDDRRTDEAELPKVFGVVYPTAREQEMTETIIGEKRDDEVLAASDLVRAYRVGYADGRDYRLGKLR